MLPVFFPYNEKSNDSFEMLKRVLIAANESYSYITDEKLCSFQGEYNHDLFLFTGEKKKIETGNIIIISHNIDEKEKLSIKAGTQLYFIYDNDFNEYTASKIKENEFLMSCGFGEKDMFSFSSFENESAVVSLQESIKTINGEYTEPSEVPLTYDIKPEKFSLLSSVAVLYLLNHQFTYNAVKLNEIKGK